MFGITKIVYKAMLQSVLVTLIPSGLVALNFFFVFFGLPGRDDPAAAIRFRDVAAKSGIGFVLDNDPTPRKHLVETMAGGVAAFDYDGDGLTDIYFTNGASLPSLTLLKRTIVCLGTICEQGYTVALFQVPRSEDLAHISKICMNHRQSSRVIDDADVSRSNHIPFELIEFGRVKHPR